MVSDTKKKLVQSLIDDVKSYSIIGVIDMRSLPAQQLQDMRAMLRAKNVKIKMARKKLIRMALKESKNKNVEALIEKIKGMPALLFTNDNPFTLYATIQKNKSEAPAKAGQEAPSDIVVPAGPTNFAPGPIISELASVGIKTKVDGGKLVMLADTTVAKEGDVITAKLAETLKRLDIKPMEVGLNLVAVWEKGLVFNAKDLHIDTAEYEANLAQAATWAMNLAMDIAYPTEDTTQLLLQKAFRDAKTTAIEASFVIPETREELLAKAEREASSVKQEANL